MDLDDLIHQVEDAAITDEPLDRIVAAMGVKADLDDVTDTLIGHFVDQARRAGCSWSEIGSAMGVTKQAAQQRHTSERPRRRERPPWRLGYRWTDRAKTVVREANGAALELGHHHLGTEHLLLGMLAIPQGIAGRLLIGAGMTREQVLARIEPASTPTRGRRRVPFTAASKEALEKAFGNAVRLGHSYVGTEHLLLGLFDVAESAGARLVTDGGLTKETVESRVIEILKKAS